MQFLGLVLSLTIAEHFSPEHYVLQGLFHKGPLGAYQRCDELEHSHSGWGQCVPSQNPHHLGSRLHCAGWILNKPLLERY